MNKDLAKWIGDADALRHTESFRAPQQTLDLAYIRDRADDYYLSLAGELFTRMREGSEDADGWASLGNALALIAAPGQELELKRNGISQAETTLFAAAAFYCGGFPASAYVTLKDLPVDAAAPQSYLACLDLLTRPGAMRSDLGRALLDGVERGDMQLLTRIGQWTKEQSQNAMQTGPTEWIPARLLEKLVDRFLVTNLRAVLPDGEHEFWTPFVQSLVRRRPSIWEFFPSQIQAIQGGLISGSQTVAVQMPTSAGKTALSEAVLYRHGKSTIFDVAILLVPYRSLASELRGSLVRHLNDLGIPTKCIYGGTVPTGDETHDLWDTQVIVATPEALSGLLSAGELIPRISLVICDEGHLLDSAGRGVGLEMLLARLKARAGDPPRFVFISAIVPNVGEISQWLGGAEAAVVQSDYRPAFAEYAVLRARSTGARGVLDLDMHAHLDATTRYSIERFLSKDDFTFRNPDTGRNNTYAFGSNNVRAIAAGRKALAMGTVAIFSANKRGAQGAIGLAVELVNQLAKPLPLPSPLQFAVRNKLDPVVGYLGEEFGAAWIGTLIAEQGAVLHHGDIPQECREVLESLLRLESIRYVICTSTLAEGVNLPIRTLVLYSVQRRERNGHVNLLARDIKNLVGRAGRAGATTKGLVICANEDQWPLVERVAKQTAGEPVHGALLKLVTELRWRLAASGRALTNRDLELTPELQELVDGIDSTLIDLAAEEIGEDALVSAATRVAGETFAAQRADVPTAQVLRSVFELRARRIAAIQSSGRLDWIKSTGSRPRLLDSVEAELLPAIGDWTTTANTTNAVLLSVFFEWAWRQRDFQADIHRAFRLDDGASTDPVKGSLLSILVGWIGGQRFREIAASTNTDIDLLLGIYTAAIAYSFQTLVEQGVALLGKLLEERNVEIPDSVTAFPEYLRFGVPTTCARTLLAGGLRHRFAGVSLGEALTRTGVDGHDKTATLQAARNALTERADSWRPYLGSLVYENSLIDLRVIATVR